MFKNIKIFFVLCSVISISSCKTETKKETSVDTDTKIDSTQITAKDIASIKYTEYALSDLAQQKTSNWQTFRELSNKIDVLKTGDLSFFKDDKAILISFIADLKNEVPDALNTTAILVRLTVIETVFLKLEGVASLPSAKKTALLAAIKDVLLAHNNLIFQINKKLEKDSQNIEKPY
jgi:hypothetical protein